MSKLIVNRPFFYNHQVATLISACAFLAPTISALDQPQQQTTTKANGTNLSALSAASAGNSSLALSKDSATSTARKLTRRAAESAVNPSKIKPPMSSLGDAARLDSALSSRGDLLPAAGEHKKYILVKKKPKHKKIKMDVYEPKMKYKKIKMKVPIKKLKKKKVKGYLVKKEHGHY